MKISPNAPCPCGSGQKYKKCCRVLHNGTPAPSPEALMRSRYTAYALGNVSYIMDTTHPDGPHFNPDRIAWQRDLEEFCDNTRFAGLHILAAAADIVTFRATLFIGERDVSFTERSLFRQHEGRWKYLSGDLLK